MTTTERMKQIYFIEADIKSRGEERVSTITFLGSIYQTKVKKDGKKKTVNYSGATNVMKGYRPILNNKKQ